MRTIYSLSLKELESVILQLSMPKYVATQIFQWIYQKLVSDWDKLTNISKKNIELLKNEFDFGNFKVEKIVDSEDNTKKFLFKLFDGNFIEAVLMKFEFGNSICISSQVGCNMGCKFCASGQLKKVRNLLPEEYILQYIHIAQYLQKNNQKISNISFMGIGEPFDNYENLSKAINIFNEPNGIGLGMRNMIVSTCGIVPKINSFAKDFEQIRLAISLHAPNNKIRNQIMPINQKWNIIELFKAVKQYNSITKKQITFEYVLLKGINDSKENALELAKLVKPYNCYVNLLVYNKVEGSGYKQSNQTEKFADILVQNGITVAVRTPKGKKVEAGCGQLRANVQKSIK